MFYFSKMNKEQSALIGYDRSYIPSHQLHNHTLQSFLQQKYQDGQKPAASAVLFHWPNIPGEKPTPSSSIKDHAFFHFSFHLMLWVPPCYVLEARSTQAADTANVVHNWIQKLGLYHKKHFFLCVLSLISYMFVQRANKTRGEVLGGSSCVV